MKKKLEKYCLDVATDTKRVMTYSYIMLQMSI